MPLVDVGSNARGVIAIGEQATGIIAIGQVACGVIAIGQMAFGFVAVGQFARGFFVLGQLAVGVFTIGQVALGAHTCFAQLGVAGRRVRSLRLRAIDRLPKTQKNAAIVQQSRIIGQYSPKPVFYTKCAYESWLFCVKIARTLPHHFPRFIGEINSSIASHD